jgi:hypothetical protein
MECAEVMAIVEKAVDRLVAEQLPLLALGVGEQTLVQPADYIREGIPKRLSVDVEYNRHGMKKKVLLLPPKDAPHAIPVSTMVRPDIVVQERGTDDHNIVALEIKKSGANLTHDSLKP